MHIESFFDQNTATITYVVSDPQTRHCAIIDSVSDFDLYSGRLFYQSANNIIRYITKSNLQLEWILETHIHADHLSAASYLKEKLGGKIGIGENIIKVLSYWVPFFNTYSDTPLDGSQFDVLLSNEMIFKIGNLSVKVLHTPGHTPACVTYQINDALFVGDTIFMPYVGTARTDFPGGSAKILFDSIQKIYSFPDQTRIFTCHDYPPTGNNPAWESTIHEQKKANIMINEGVSEKEFIALRNKKDFNKAVPQLLLPSVQVNLRAGQIGAPEDNQTFYLKIPINKL